MEFKKYRPFEKFVYNERKWPQKQITKAPIWCSVDLRDGNQALVTPMNLEQKINLFNFLVKTGFKQIEIGFPAASDTEFLFTRTLIENNLIPDDVTIQVLTQARDHIIEKTYEALEGVKSAVVHLYNSTSTLQRKVVFKKSKDEIKALAIYGAKKVLEMAHKYGRERFAFQYSPESFTGTEMDYAKEVCNAVLEIWQPDENHKAIINLPSTVEMSLPNVYADQIEYMCNNLLYRKNVLVCIHAHNDRGTAVAATELALLAGADRVEGTLFGNGERTGNADVLNIAMNLYTQGIDPKLDFSQISEVVDIYEKSTSMFVHPRHPYAGDLVFTAFSGSHQDAINKGMACLGEKYEYWEVPYLPIDPKDVGRDYEAIIRINSQSGKGGVAYILEQKYGLIIPKPMQQNFGNFVTQVSDTKNSELLPEELYNLFKTEYINIEDPISLVSYNEKTNGESIVDAIITIDSVQKKIEGHGNGILDAFCKALMQQINFEFDIINYNEHSLEYGSKSRAITYMHIKDKNDVSYFGAGVSSSISKSSLKAIVSAVNKMIKSYK